MVFFLGIFAATFLISFWVTHRWYLGERLVPLPHLGHTWRMLKPSSSKPRPDYRLIWDLEEELGFEHLDSEKRPLRSWMSDKSQDPVMRAVEQWAEVQDWVTGTQQANLRRAREKALLSSVDQSLRSSGERGFL